MADSQRSDIDVKGPIDAPKNVTGTTREVYLQAELDRERAAHRETRSQVIDLIGKGLEQAVQLDVARKQLARREFWSDNVYLAYCALMVAIMTIGFVVIPAVTR